MNLFDLYAKIVFDDSDYNTGLERAQKRTTTFGTTLRQGLQAAATAAAGAISAASTAVVALGKVALDYNSQIEDYVSNFTVLLGDAELAVKKVDELKELGARTPFEMTDLAKATQTLLAFNVSADDSTGVLTRLGDISLGNVSKFESLTRAYGKMNAAQKVTLEDINMMIDAGFNPLLIVAENTGETMTELYDRVSDGEVAFSEIQDAIELATSAGGMYYEGMKTASETTSGMISTLKDNAQSLIGEVFKPISEGLTGELLPAAIKSVEKLTDAYREKGVDGMIDAAGEMVGAAVGEIAKEAPSVVSSGVGIVDSLVKGIGNNAGAIVQGASDTFFAFVGGVADLIPSISDTAVSLITSFGQYISNNPDKVVSAAGSIFGSFVSAVADSIPELAETAAEVVTSLGNYLYENAPEILASAANLGIQLVEGIWDGIVSLWDELTEKFTWLSDALVAGANAIVTGGIGDVPLGGANPYAPSTSTQTTNNTTITNNISGTSNPKATAKATAKEIKKSVDREAALY